MINRSLWSRLGYFVLCTHAAAIDLRVYSEFQSANAPEVLSPAVVRNAFATFRVVVTAPRNTLYFLVVQTNPPGIFDIRLYREGGNSGVEERNLSFLAGVTPAAAGGSDSATRYLLDVRVPAETRPGPVRVEVLVKTADWRVAPMEFRVLPVTVPSLPVSFASNPAWANMKPDEIAFATLVDGIARGSASQATAGGSAAAMIARNAAQDAAIALTLDEHARRRIMEAALAAYLERRWMFYSPRGSESYLPIRRMIYREAATRQATHETPRRAPGSR